jgi:hypothetical protein
VSLFAQRVYLNNSPPKLNRLMVSALRRKMIDEKTKAVSVQAANSLSLTNSPVVTIIRQKIVTVEAYCACDLVYVSRDQGPGLLCSGLKILQIKPIITLGIEANFAA